MKYAVAALVAAPVAFAALAAPPSLAQSAEEDDGAASQPSVLSVPPPGGITQGIAGTDDLEALVRAQRFDVESVAVLDLETQEMLVYLPAAPGTDSSLPPGALRATDIVTLRRSTDDAGAGPAGDTVGRGWDAPLLPPRLPTPPAGGIVQGIAGTHDPAHVAMRQRFAVESIAVLDPQRQRWLVHMPGAPDEFNTLHAGDLTPDAIVNVKRRGGAPARSGHTVVAVREAPITYYYCRQGTVAASIGDGGGWCGTMRNGETVHTGAAACDAAYLGQRFRIRGDPSGRVYTCKDTGSAVHGEHRDIWFANSDDGLRWWRTVGNVAVIEILGD